METQILEVHSPLVSWNTSDFNVIKLGTSLAIYKDEVAITLTETEVQKLLEFLKV